MEEKHCTRTNMINSNTQKAIVLLDAKIADYQTLAAGVEAGTEVIILDPTKDGISQVTTELASRSDISAVHIVSHGAPGCLYLGNAQLSLETLCKYAEQLQECFFPGGSTSPSLFIYGCKVAAGDVGEEFLAKLRTLTGANIAASANLTGNAALGGDWNLEVTLGEKKFASAFTPEVMAAYPSVLEDKVDFDVLTAFNIDGIVNRNSGVTDSTQSAIDKNNFSLITQSFAAATAGGIGLPDDGLFAANSFHPEIQLQYKNTDNGNNLRLINTTTGAFNFTVTPGTYSEIHVAALSTQASSDIRLVFTYSDGTTAATTAATVPDWYDEIPESTSRYYLSNGMDRATTSGTFQNAKDPALFGLRFVNPNSSKTVTNIQVEKTGGAGYLSFFGATGISSGGNIELPQFAQDWLDEKYPQVQINKTGDETTATYKGTINLDDAINQIAAKLKLGSINQQISVTDPTLVVKGDPKNPTYYKLSVSQLPAGQIMDLLGKLTGADLFKGLSSAGNVDLVLASNGIKVDYPDDIKLNLNNVIDTSKANTFVTKGIDYVETALKENGAEITLSNSSLQVTKDTETEIKIETVINGQKADIYYRTPTNFKLSLPDFSGVDLSNLLSGLIGQIPGIKLPSFLPSLNFKGFDIELSLVNSLPDFKFSIPKLNIGNFKDLFKGLGFTLPELPLFDLPNLPDFSFSIGSNLFQIGSLNLKFGDFLKGLGLDLPSLPDLNITLPNLDINFINGLPNIELPSLGTDFLRNLLPSIDIEIPDFAKELLNSLINEGKKFKIEPKKDEFKITYLDSLNIQSIVNKLSTELGLGTDVLGSPLKVTNPGLTIKKDENGKRLYEVFVGKIAPGEVINFLTNVAGTPLPSDIQSKLNAIGNASFTLSKQGISLTYLEDLKLDLNEITGTNNNPIGFIQDAVNKISEILLGDGDPNLPGTQLVLSKPQLKLTKQNDKKELSLAALLNDRQVGLDFKDGKPTKFTYSLPKEIDFASLVGNVPVLNSLKLHDPKFTVASAAETIDDATLGVIDLTKGFNFTGKLDFGNNPDDFSKFIGDKLGLKTLGVHIGIDPGTGASLKGKLAGNIPLFSSGNFSAKLNDAGLKLAVNQSGPSVGIEGGITLTGYDPFQLNEPALNLSGAITVDKTSLTGTLQLGTSKSWVNPFGIPDAEIRNLAVQLGGTYTPPYVDNVGIVGDLKFGNFDLKAAFLVDTNDPNKNALELTVNKPVGLVDILLGPLGSYGLNQAAKKSNVVKDGLNLLNKVIDVKVVSVDGPDPDKEIDPLIKFVPFETKIGKTTLEQGIAINGELTAWGKTATLNIEANPYASNPSLTGSLKIPEINLGFAKFTGVGDREMNLDLKVDRQKQYFGGDASLEIFGKNVGAIKFSVDNTNINIEQFRLGFSDVLAIELNSLKFNPKNLTGSGSGKVKLFGQDLADAKFSINEKEFSVSGRLGFNILGYDVGVGVGIALGNNSNKIELTAKAGSLFNEKVSWDLNKSSTITSVYDWVEGLVTNKLVGFVNDSIVQISNGWNAVTAGVAGVWNDIAGVFRDTWRAVSSLFSNKDDVWLDDNNNFYDGKEGNDYIRGKGGDDWLVGGEDNDTLEGWSGQDKLEGNTGEDKLYGDAGNDLLEGGSGNDSLYGRDDNDFLKGGDDRDDLQGGNGNDRLEGEDGNDSLNGESGKDSLYGGNHDDTLYGGTGEDMLDGASGNDYLSGGGDNDRLYGNTGDDKLLGEDGSDELHGYIGKDILQGDSGNDILYGQHDNDVLKGGDGDDYLFGEDNGKQGQTYDGSNSNDTLDGEAGNDFLFGGFGNDVLYAGIGNDFLQAGDGNDELHGYVGNDLLDGGTGNDILYGQHDNDIVNGGDGNDYLYGEDNGKQGQTYNGDSHDTLNGGNGDDFLYGGIGNDTLSGGMGYDFQDGGAGNDTVDYSFWNGGITADLSTGKVTLVTLSGEEQLVDIENIIGSSGNDRLYGDNQNNKLYGGAGNDTLNGGMGYDFQDGGAGNDTVDYSFWNGGITADLSTGKVTLVTVSGEEQLVDIENIIGSSGGDQITGSQYENHLRGGDGNDTLFAKGVNDTLEGGNGNDILEGEIGTKVLSGGAGDDILRISEFYRGAIYATLDGGAGNDTLSLLGKKDDYQITQTDTGWEIQHRDNPKYRQIVTGVENFTYEIRRGGSISNGPLAGATVFLDTNGNFQLDAGEAKTVADNNGKYTLRTASNLDENEQIVAIGGIDTTTGLPATLPLISKVGTAAEPTITTPLTTLKAVLASQGIVPAQVEALLEKISGLSLASLSQPLDNFDPYATIGQNDSSAINIASGHIKLMNLLLNGTNFLKAAKYQGSNPEIQVIFALGEVLQQVDTFDLSKTNDLQTLLTQITQKHNLSITDEAIASVAELVAQSNQLVDDLVAKALDRSVSTVLPSINPIKKAVYSTLPEVTQQLVKGEITAQQSQTKLQELLADTFLVQYALNENRTVQVTVSPTITEGDSNSQGQFTITLGEAAPAQGLKILYTLSGTATLGQDYSANGGLFGEINIAPGATSGVINLSVLDDTFSEKPEAVTINLKHVGDGYALDPVYQTANLKIADNDEGGSTNRQNGIRRIGTFGNDRLTGEAGNDNLSGSYGNDVIEGLAGNDQLMGGAGEDTILGGEGNDKLEGNFSADILRGNAGDDLLAGDAANDTLEGNEGNDQLQGNAGDDQLQGNVGNDILKGGSGNDVLNGNEENDWLVGETGEDILIGGDGADLLNGGNGADVFYINAPSEGGDLILDFDPTQGDKIQISATGFNTQSLEDFSFLAGKLQFQEQELALIQNNGQTYNHFANLAEVIEIVSQPTAQPAPAAAEVPTQTTPSVANPDLVDRPEATILDDIIRRGQIKLGTSSSGSEFDFEFVRTLAAALFGDASKVERVTTTFSDAFEQVVDGTVDITAQRSTHYLGEDAAGNIDFSPIYFYDHQAVVVRKNSGIENALDLQGRTIGTIEGSYSLEDLQNRLSPQGVKFTSKLFDNLEEVAAAYARGEIDAYATDRALILERLDDPEKHRILDVELSKEPIALALPENDSQWADVVRWVNYVPIQAEEFGINSENIDQLIAANTDDDSNNDSSPAIRRFLGLEGDLGASLGLPKDFAVNIIKQVGNYEEIYERHFSGLERDQNLLWTEGGLLYSPPFSGQPIDATLVDNDQRNLLAEVLQRGSLKLGLPGNDPGFTVQQANGEFAGFDVDLGRAIAAALFGDPSKLEIQVQSFQDSFANTANGVVDVSAMGITHNLVRDAGLGVDFSPTYLYTGQGVLVRADSSISVLPALNGHRVGTLEEATSLQNLQDTLSEFGSTFIPVTFASNDEMFAAYDRGEIDAVSTDLTILNTRIPTLSNPNQHRILDEVLSKEPLALITDENQSEWADVVRWVYNALVQAEEFGITSENIDELIARNTDNNPANDSSPAIRQFLGLEGYAGTDLGLPNDFAVKAIKAVGNYGEIYERHFNSNVLRRDHNELFGNFGLQYALPSDGTNVEAENPSLLLFDANFYLKRYPDVAIAVANGAFPSAFEHFDQYGFIEGREPSAVFAIDYLAQNQDVAAAVTQGAFKSGFEHFMKYGMAEGRNPASQLASFETFYLAENPDVAQAVKQEDFRNGLEHLIQYGMAEGRNPTSRYQVVAETFDSTFYLAKNPDVAQAVQQRAFRDGLEHFVHFGMFEGRDPSLLFNNSYYLSQNLDVAVAVSQNDFKSGFEHFMLFGMAEGRIGEVVGSTSAEQLQSNTGANSISGSAGNDTVMGSEGNDFVSGDLGNDILFGSLGDDTLNGSAGDDLLNGGEGRDTFVLTPGSGTDAIADFALGKDLMRLAGGITSEQLTITQGIGTQSQDTLIRLTNTGEVLASLTGLSASSITPVVFTLT